MTIHPAFEETYTKHEFAGLVRLVLLVADRLGRYRRAARHRAAAGRGSMPPGPRLTPPGAGGRAELGGRI